MADSDWSPVLAAVNTPVYRRNKLLADANDPEIAKIGGCPLSLRKHFVDNNLRRAFFFLPDRLECWQADCDRKRCTVAGVVSAQRWIAVRSPGSSLRRELSRTLVHTGPVVRSDKFRLATIRTGVPGLPRVVARPFRAPIFRPSLQTTRTLCQFKPPYLPANRALRSELPGVRVRADTHRRPGSNGPIRSRVRRRPRSNRKNPTSSRR